MIAIIDGIQAVQSVYSRGVQSKDSRLTKRHIYQSLITARATYLQQKSNKNQPLSSVSYQTIYVELEKVKEPPLSCIPSSQTVLRSKYKLPTIINDMEGEMVDKVTTVEGKTINSTSVGDAPYKATSKYKLPVFRGVIESGYLYVYGNSFLKMAVVRAAFQDPIEVYQFPNPCDPCTTCKCKDITEIEFPIDTVGFGVIIDIVLSKLLTVFIQMKEDRENNATDDAGGGTMIHQPQQTQAQ